MVIKDKLFKGKQEINYDADIAAIVYFFSNLNPHLESIVKSLKKLTELRKKEIISDDKEKNNILKEQIDVFDELLKDYEIFELDTDINGERVKKLAKYLRKKAKKAKLSKEIIKKTKKERWTFDW